MSDYTVIQELLTRDIKLKTLDLNNWLNLYCGNLFAKMLARNKMSFIHMYSFKSVNVIITVQIAI